MGGLLNLHSIGGDVCVMVEAMWVVYNSFVSYVPTEVGGAETIVAIRKVGVDGVGWRLCRAL